MTDMHSEDRPNWVAERATCTLEVKFAELVNVMRFDVDQINKQPCRIRHHQLFAVETEPHRFRVRRHPAERPRDSSGYVTLELSKKKLNVHSPKESFEIFPCWNEDALSCDLLIDDEPVDLWRISQRALGDFFFSD